MMTTFLVFETFMGEEEMEAEVEDNTAKPVDSKTLMVVLLSKKNQILNNEPLAAQAPPPSLEPWIDNLVVDNKDSLHCGKSLTRRIGIEGLLRLKETNSLFHFKYSTKMLQLGEAFPGSLQPSTRVSSVTFLRGPQKTSKAIRRKYKFYIELLFPPFPADKNQVSAGELVTNKPALHCIKSRGPNFI